MRMTAIKHANNALLQVPDSDLFSFWVRKEHVVNVILLSKIVLLIILLLLWYSFRHVCLLFLHPYLFIFYFFYQWFSLVKAGYLVIFMHFLLCF